LKGNIQPAQNYVQDLLGLIDLYQAKMPNPDAEIEAEIEEIDLEFVREDLPNIINSMNAGVDRIRNISDGLRIFSRQDRDHKTAFYLHDWQFTDEQKLQLQRYYDANKFLVELMQIDGAVSDKVRAEIEDTLLLPWSELQRRQPGTYRDLP